MVKNLDGSEAFVCHDIEGEEAKIGDAAQAREGNEVGEPQ